MKDFVPMFVDHLWLDNVLRGLVLTAMAMCWIVLLVRVNGLRSFSKMTNFDFVMTVAVGSLLAGSGQSRTWPNFLQSLAGISSLFLVQYSVARLRQVWPGFQEVTQNTPVLLMQDGEFLDGALRRARVAKNDLVAKLREANVLELGEVRAVVLETTGDISVLHGEHLGEALLTGVRSGPERPSEARA